jgi:dipeptidyl aminopeptidase/acylaminoacyl peptidase
VSLNRKVSGFDVFIDSASPSQHLQSLATKPVMLFTAADDKNVPTQNVKDFAAAIEQSGGKQVRLITTATGGHYHSMIEKGIPAGIAFLKEIDAKSQR